MGSVDLPSFTVFYWNLTIFQGLIDFITSYYRCLFSNWSRTLFYDLFELFRRVQPS